MFIFFHIKISTEETPTVTFTILLRHNNTDIQLSAMEKKILD